AALDGLVSWRPGADDWLKCPQTRLTQLRKGHCMASTIDPAVALLRIEAMRLVFERVLTTIAYTPTTPANVATDLVDPLNEMRRQFRATKGPIASAAFGDPDGTPDRDLKKR